MKNILTFLFLLFITFLFSQNRPKDTLAVREVPDCTEYIRSNQEKYDQFAKEKQVTDYKNLTKLLIENIDVTKIPSKNLIVFVDYKETREAILPEDFYQCWSNHNLINPAYNERDFWRKKTFEVLREKLKKNLIPQKIENHNGNNIIKFINTQNKFSLNSYYYYFISLSLSFTKDHEEFFYLPYDYVTIVDPKESNSILIKFKNYLGRKVDAEIIYNYNTSQMSVQQLRFQYWNNDWKQIK